LLGEGPASLVWLGVRPKRPLSGPSQRRNSEEERLAHFRSVATGPWKIHYWLPGKNPTRRVVRIEPQQRQVRWPQLIVPWGCWYFFPSGTV